ncbi:MAG: hypothetical protein A3B38_02685 [Candidatus Levybacteria bacterium RIFCSPLOWO2_01_FULL_36_13]|nr:MAG: hypothetical protein A2684_03880 [Candidatus Levybacteria bacterium RIFCSPHIGHO2_01_FULL_36_15b]OGH35184.1 MAG: hypothetical protein A3B38_02685 [Candidatus Levybacteria bacterium RIFCSPLOWO2_01_FULL_36_13]
MTATGHAIIGTVIAAKIGNPALAIPLAVASHVVADSIPHWDTATNRKEKSWNKLIFHTLIDISAGFLISFLLIYFLFPDTNYFYAVVMIFAAQSFDWLTAPYYFFKIQLFKPFYNLQKSFEHEIELPWGFMNQAIIVTAIVILAIIF